MTDNWKWYAGRDGENFDTGPFDCREDAIADATDNYNDEDGFHIVEATKPAFPPPSAESIIDDMFERASDDLFGDDYPEPCGSTEKQKQAELELQAYLNLWMDKWRSEIFPTPWAFGKTRNADYILNPQQGDTL